MANIAPAGIINLLKEPDSNNQTWIDLVNAFEQVVTDNIEHPIQSLETIRYITIDADQDILQRTARMLGFDVTQDVLNLNSESLTKVVTQLAMYPDKNGTEIFNKFIDLILNSTTTINNLYTTDYMNFSKTHGTLIHEGGKWFKTTHIELSVEILSSALDKFSPGLFRRILGVFYNFCPIALVIKHFYFIITFKDEDYPGGKAFGLGVLLPPVEKIVVVE